MATIKQKTTTVHIGELQIELKSDVFDGELLDTEVKVCEGESKVFLTCVSGAEAKQFCEELEALIQKFQI